MFMTVTCPLWDINQASLLPQEHKEYYIHFMGRKILIRSMVGILELFSTPPQPQSQAVFICLGNLYTGLPSKKLQVVYKISLKYFKINKAKNLSIALQ